MRVEAGGDWATSAAAVLDAVGKGDLVLLQADTIEQTIAWLSARYGSRLREAGLDDLAGCGHAAPTTAAPVPAAGSGVPKAGGGREPSVT